MNTIWKWILAIAGVAGSVFWLMNNKKPIEIAPDFDDLKEEPTKKLEEIKKKEEELKEHGVEDKTPKEVIDYWNKQ